MSATEYVILVDEHDQQTGTAEKLLAHQQNLLHRAFSIFIFRDATRQDVLLQQRALSKYHSPGLWTNTCCSHPRPGESVLEAGERRLQEEFGFTASLIDVGSFHYNVPFANGLWENELDHVLVGVLPPDAAIKPNPDEIEAYRWVAVEELQHQLSVNPGMFTPWLLLALELAV